MNEHMSHADVWAALQALARMFPQMRAGQLMAAIGELGTDRYGRGLWEMTDTELSETIWQFQRNYVASTASSPS